MSQDGQNRFRQSDRTVRQRQTKIEQESIVKQPDKVKKMSDKSSDKE